MCVHSRTLKTTAKLILSSIYPDLFVDNELFKRRLYPLSNHFSYLLEESGYLHLQATKPDTIGKIEFLKLIRGRETPPCLGR